MNKKNRLKIALEKFVTEANEALIATGIVSNDGTLQAYATHGARGSAYNVEKSALVFAMMINVLNNTLGDVYDGIENVTELKATAKNNFFLFRLIKNGKYFHGVTYTDISDSTEMSKLMEKYEERFADALA